MPIGRGIDIAKDEVDAALSDGTVLGSFFNSIAGMDPLVARLRATELHRVVIEASGGYGRLALASLHDTGFTVVLVQPAHARHFAKALGRYAKTDEIDAGTLAKMAPYAVDEVEPWRPLDEDVAALRALVERRVQLVALIDAETKWQRDATAAVVATIEALLKSVRGA